MSAAWLFTFIAPVSAQTASEGELSPNGAAALDPIAANERSLVFDDAPAPPAAQTASSAGVILRMILVLALVAAAVYGAVFFIKRTAKRGEVKNPFLKVLASAHLGFNRYVHVVSLGSRAWLVGASEGGVHTISEIEDKDALNALFLEESRKSAETPGGLVNFRDLLRRFGMQTGGEGSGPESIRKRRERLKGL